MDEQVESGPIPFDPEEPLDSESTVVEAINARFARGSARMHRLEEELKRNTEMTREMYEILTMAKTGIAAIGKLGRGLAMAGRWLLNAVKVLTPLAVGLIALYHAVQSVLTGAPPPK